MRIAHAQLWVTDQDEALDFYTKKLGMEVRSDVTLPEMGNFRWLTVGPAGQPDFAITLMAIPGAPGSSPPVACEPGPRPNLRSRALRPSARSGGGSPACCRRGPRRRSDSRRPNRSPRL